MSASLIRHPPPSRLKAAARLFSVMAIFTALLASSFVLFYFESGRLISAGHPRLKVWFFDVGQGDAILIETPDRKQMLIDGGPDDAVLTKLGEVLPPWDRTLDAVLFTHPDADHIGGLPAVLDRYQVGAVYESGLENSTGIMRKLESAIAAEGTLHIFISSGDQIDFGPVKMSVLFPQEKYQGLFIKDTNRASLVLLLTYQDTSVLLTGDAVAADEPVFTQDIDVLKVGHHGSDTSTGYSFITGTQPEIAVISVGRSNRYGHPHPAVLRRLLDANIRIFRTDLDGDILLTSDGGEPVVVSSPLPF